MARFEIVISNKRDSAGRRIALGRVGTWVATVLMTLVAIALVVLALVLGYAIAGVIIAALIIVAALALLRGLVRSLRR